MTTVALTQTRKPFRNPIATFFDAIGPTVYDAGRELTVPPNFARISTLCLVVAAGLFLVAVGQGAGRRFVESSATFYYWSGLFLLVIPIACRVASPNVARGERLFLLLVLAEGLYVFMRLYSPTRFYGYDEYAHWVTAHDILHRHKLFLENPLLPVSPFYAALEIVTTAFANLTGLAVFPAAWFVLFVLRGIFTTGLFLFIERITDSPRLAAIVGLIYMSAPTYSVFDGMFSYESLGVVLVVFLMWTESKISYEGDYRSLIVPIAVLGCLAITHHASAMLAVSYLIGVAATEAIRQGSKARFAIVGAIGIVAFLLVFLWESMPQNPVRDYLGSAFSRELNAMIEVINGQTEAHTPFKSASGEQQAIWIRFTAMGSVVLISMFLATGFFRALTWMSPERGWRRFLTVFKRQWYDSRILLLTIGALGFPVSMLFRLSAGWEIGARMGTWVFIAVGLVVGVSIIQYWEGLWWWRRSCTNFVVCTILVGGLVLALGNHPIQGRYVVISDDASIEPMGIDAASWTKDWLGSGNNFAADRDNQLLLATYGDQNVVTNSNTRTSRAVDVSYAFLDRTVDKLAISSIKRGNVQYLEVDLRNSTDLPLLGAYFRPGEPSNGRPPTAQVLLKYDHRPDVSRVFDNGSIVIYNVGKLKVDAE